MPPSSDRPSRPVPPGGPRDPDPDGAPAPPEFAAAAGPGERPAPRPAEPESPRTMLLVDDDTVFRERLARAFRDRGFDVSTAADPQAAIDLARFDSPEMAVVDLRMPGGSGLDVLRELKAIDPATEVVVLTGYGSISTAVDAVKLGAANYLPKPADADDILQAFERAAGGEGSAAGDGFRAPSLARAEWEHINRVLGDCSGNISEAARRLGIHRRSLQRKLHKFAPD